MCAHNEEEYIGRALASVYAQTLKPYQVIVILDRCTDNTRNMISKCDVLVEKKVKRWKNSYAENLELGRKYAKGEYYAIIDADVELPPKYFEEIINQFDSETACASGIAITVSPNLLGRIIRFKEKFYDRFVKLEKSHVRGCCMVIDKKFLDKIGGFRDFRAPDTYIVQEAKRCNLKVKQVPIIVKHTRKLTLSKIIRNQINSGKGRREQNVSFIRTLLHSIFRLRPFVLVGYFLE
jgi:cellulose synthase/poly-beta-1,6-N-acetylglucosamine synthase-like glycosyltransferase